MGKVELKKLTKTQVFRKIAMGTWKTAADPSVYTLIDIDMSKTLPFMDEYSKKHGIKITPTHVVAKAVSYVFKNNPEINGMIRGSRIYLRKNVSIFFQVNVPGEGEHKVKKSNLSGCTVHNTENMNLLELVKAIDDKVTKVKNGKEKELKRSLDIIKYVPWCMMRLFLNLTSFFIYGLNLNLTFLGFPKDPFGSVMITNIGSLGLKVGFAPICPYTRVPLLVTTGLIHDKPLAINGQIKIRPVMPVTITFDHRFMDGSHGAKMAKEFERCFEEPEKYLI